MLDVSHGAVCPLPGRIVEAHIKPNSKSIVILIESFNIMENVRVGLRQSKLGQNVEILYLNVNRTEKIRDSSDLQSLPEPNILTDKTGGE